MSNKKLFDDEIRFRVPGELKKQIEIAASEMGRSVPDYMRIATREFVSISNLEKRKDALQSLVAVAVEEKLRPVENRLAKINAKTAHAAAIALYLEAALLQDLGKRDVVEAFRIARNKAIAFVREDIPNTTQLESLAKNAATDAEEKNK